MKTILFLFAILSVTYASHAQSKGTIKLYGFEQSVSKGRAPEIDSETGLRTSQGAGKNYYIYAVSSSRIYPAEIWIEGERYGVTIKSINETPVEHGDERNIGSPKKVLIPKTTQKVIQLIPVQAVAGKASYTKAKSLARSNDLVVVYKQNGKFYYQSLSKLSNLEGAAMQ